MSDPLAPARDALTTCDEVLARLELKCCDPGRSPSMAALGDTLSGAAAELGTLDDGSTDAGRVLDALEDAGAQIGRLQVGCCAPNRLPLYTEMLENLTRAQLAVNQAMGTGH